ncbi:uncharacterized protein LOC125206949 [Salvia hispanica]|uniref:uncharacterized protein LOC125204997 n=1 Tax=Salvia hispanica TaxID=49212 RepID=UPI00200914E4|nr:uncharacterized protein LOC125204997 [Salvia hispanica]XP_047962118.1 uncharacterized protein LOC125206949 [Salvia hispanica]
MKALMEYKMLADLRLLLIAFLCIPIGFLFGSFLREIHEVQKDTFYSPFDHSYSSYADDYDSRNMSKETAKRPRYLLALAVGIQQKDIVNKIVSKFNEDFAIMLFHYDGKTSEWDKFEWSQRAIHTTGLKQTKWWFAKRFLHPDVVAEFEYIFIWDEDLGVDNFTSEEYIKIVKKHGLEISQPAITSSSEPTYKITMKRNNVEVHKDADEKCENPLYPPCAGFIEIMAPVFSKESWSCVWKVIQNDLVHGWGIDFAFWRCVKVPHENIGVVDAQWVEHLVLPTLGTQTRARSYEEWKEFERRMKEAEKQESQKQSKPPI